MSVNPHVTEVPDEQTEVSAAGAGAAWTPAPLEPEEVQTRFGAAINDGDSAAFGDLVAPDCVDHDPAPGQTRGAAGYANLFGELRRSFPDLHVEVDHLLTADDQVSIAYTLTGTHTGSDYRGHRATGNGIAVRGVQIARVVDGRMVERWGASDEFGILRQLGVLET